jgi:hypothetical protein
MNSYPNQNPDSNWWTPQNLPEQNLPNASQWGQSPAGQPYGAQSPNGSTSYGGQAPYQQGGYPYQQPYYPQGDYQQNPYQQASPYAPARPAIVFDYRYLAAGIGAIVSLISFFLTYYTGHDAILDTTFATTGVRAAGADGRYWLDPIIALVAIIIPVLLQFGKQWFRTSATPMLQKLVNSLDTKPRDWGLRLFITGLAGIFVHFILDLNELSIWGVGAWFYLLGMIAVAVGGFLVYRPPASMSARVTPPPTFR